MTIGSPVNTLDPQFTRADFSHMFKATKPIVVFCDIEVYEVVGEVLSELNNNAEIFTSGGSKNETYNESIFM